MVQQIWKYPEQGVVQLWTYAHLTFREQIDEKTINNINQLSEDEVLWYLRKL
jgi:hypothetical protein